MIRALSILAGSRGARRLGSARLGQRPMAESPAQAGGPRGDRFQGRAGRDRALNRHRCDRRKTGGSRPHPILRHVGPPKPWPLAGVLGNGHVRSSGDGANTGPGRRPGARPDPSPSSDDTSTERHDALQVIGRLVPWDGLRRELTAKHGPGARCNAQRPPDCTSARRERSPQCDVDPIAGDLSRSRESSPSRCPQGAWTSTRGAHHVRALSIIAAIAALAVSAAPASAGTSKKPLGVKHYDQ